MADLRAAAEAAGLQEVRSLLATGNLLFTSRKGAESLMALLEKVLTGFGLELPENAVFLMTPTELKAVMAAVPFADAVQDHPSRLLYVATATPPDDAALARMAAWERGPERLQAVGSGVFIDYPDGVGASQLTPKRLEKLLGQPGTGRNWNTLDKLIADPQK